MKMKVFSFATLITAVSGFGAPAPISRQTALQSDFCAGLPGALDPVGEFDPFGFTEGKTDAVLKRYREAELTHGRVSMLAFVGFLVGEKVEGSSFLFDSQISGPAINHFAQVPQPFWEILVLTIGVSETYRAQVGWKNPQDTQGEEGFQLRDEYTPGDLAWDPLGLAPEDPQEFSEMQTKELQHGRLAMLATAGFVAQELTDGKGILEHFQN